MEEREGGLGIEVEEREGGWGLRCGESPRFSPSFFLNRWGLAELSRAGGGGGSVVFGVFAEGAGRR